MDRSGAEGGAYLLHSNVSIRSGKRKHLLFIGKLEQKDVSVQLGGCVRKCRQQERKRSG